MSIKSAIDKKSGVVSKNIEDAINNLEIGGGSGGTSLLIMHESDGVLDKTWQQIYDAMLAGNIPFLLTADGENSISAHMASNAYQMDGSGCTVVIMFNNNRYNYWCSSADQYPTMQSE